MLAQLTLARSLAATFCLLFLALSTPMTEIAGLLRSLGTPGLLIELMTIAYRQLFIFLEIAAQIRTAQEARLGYSSLRLAMKSTGGLAGNILIRSLARARQNHLGLLARGYDSELLFLSPQRTYSIFNLIAVATVGTTLIALSLAIKP
jgi:cobalt/nickel transport system permease protein